MSLLKVQVQHHLLSDGAQGFKEDIDLRAGSGIAQSVFMHRNGSRGGSLPQQYGNVNWSDGYFANVSGGKHASFTFMSDYEVAGVVDARRAHTLLGAAMRTQRSTGVANRDIDELYDFTDVSDDTLEINNLEVISPDNTNSMVVVTTGGIADQDIDEVALPVGAGTVNLTIPFVADLLYVGTVSRTVAPSVDDAKTDGGGGDQRAYENDAHWCTGVAWRNGVSTVQRCMAYEEVRTQGDPSPPYPTDAACVLRNDSVATKITDTATDFTVSVTDWEAGAGNTEIELTASAGANGEYLVYHAIKFDDPSKVALVDTTMPGASGDWAKTGLSGKPQAVIARTALNVSAWNTPTKADLSLNTIAFDGFEAYTSTIGSSYNDTPVDGSGESYMEDSMLLNAESAPGVDYTAAEYGTPVMTSDGFSAPEVTSPAADIPGFAVVFFEDIEVSTKVAVAGYATA